MLAPRAFDRCSLPTLTTGICLLTTRAGASWSAGSLWCPWCSRRFCLRSAGQRRAAAPGRTAGHDRALLRHSVRPLHPLRPAGAARRAPAPPRARASLRCRSGRRSRRELRVLEGVSIVGACYAITVLLSLDMPGSTTEPTNHADSRMRHSSTRASSPRRSTSENPQPRGFCWAVVGVVVSTPGGARLRETEG